MLYQDMEMPETFGVTKFQIQQPVTVRILELFRMKITWGKLDIKKNAIIVEHCHYSSIYID
jgi:hypothetical protein